MVTTDTIRGTIEDAVTFHYDVGNDVLYLRRTERAESSTLGEETDDGLIEERDEETAELLGLTVVSWWKRFGEGLPIDSIRDLQARVEPLAERLEPLAVGG